jgi:hypothetical protein
LVELPVWYDVDDAATLAVLEAELLEGKRPRLRRWMDMMRNRRREFCGAGDGGGQSFHAKERLCVEGRVDDERDAVPAGHGLAAADAGVRLGVRRSTHYVIGASGCSGWSVWLYYVLR